MRVAMMNSKPGGNGVISRDSNGGVSNGSNGGVSNSGCDRESSPQTRYIESMNPMMRRQKDLFRTIQELQKQSGDSKTNVDQTSNREDIRTNIGE